MKKILLTILLTLSIGQLAFAAVTIPDKYRPNNLPQTVEVGAYDSDTINAYLQFFAGKLIKIAGPLAVMMIVIAGVIMATSRGEDQLERAKKHITYAIIGLCVILVSYVIVQTVITIVLDVNSPSENVQNTETDTETTTKTNTNTNEDTDASNQYTQPNGEEEQAQV